MAREVREGPVSHDELTANPPSPSPSKIVTLFGKMEPSLLGTAKSGLRSRFRSPMTRPAGDPPVDHTELWNSGNVPVPSPSRMHTKPDESATARSGAPSRSRSSMATATGRDQPSSSTDPPGN